jgi:hypothetical protein
MYDVFYMFRTRGFIFRKKVVYTDMVYYIVKLYYSAPWKKRHKIRYISISFYRTSKNIYSLLVSPISSSLLSKFKAQSPPSPPPQKLKLHNMVSRYFSLSFRHLHFLDWHFCVLDLNHQTAGNTRHNSSTEQWAVDLTHTIQCQWCDNYW